MIVKNKYRSLIVFYLFIFIAFDSYAVSTVNVVCKASATDEDALFAKTADGSFLEFEGDWGFVKLNNNSIKFFNINGSYYSLLVDACHLSGAVDLYPFPAGGFLFGSYLENN